MSYHDHRGHVSDKEPVPTTQEKEPDHCCQNEKGGCCGGCKNNEQKETHAEQP